MYTPASFLVTFSNVKLYIQVELVRHVTLLGDNFLGGELRVVFSVSSKMVSVAVQSMVILSPS